jgi:hypothetical protein
MNRALSGLWYGPLCVATVLLHTLKGVRLRLRQGDGTLLTMVKLAVMDGIRNRYNRSHEEIMKLCEQS